MASIGNWEFIDYDEKLPKLQVLTLFAPGAAHLAGLRAPLSSLRLSRSEGSEKISRARRNQATPTTDHANSKRGGAAAPKGVTTRRKAS